jgi:hypothetical protein
MKTQRRHELQTNVLADYLGKQIQEIRPHARTITIAILAVLVVALGYMYFSGQRQAKAGVAWSDYFKAVGNRDANSLEEVSKLHAGTAAALWAHQAVGDLKLAEGAGRMYTDRKESARVLREAEEHYRAIEKATSAPPLLTERAYFGLAQVYETDNDLAKAKNYYEKVARAGRDSALAKAAKRRGEQLSDKDVESWCNWFEHQEPVARRTSKDGQEGPKVPEDLDHVPGKPDLPSEEPGQEPAKPAAGKTAPPSPPATPKPAPESKDQEAEPAAPGAEKPAESKPAEQ